MRENWRAVGEALKVGRGMHPSDKAFGKWCREEGFDMHREARADAMWYAENFGVVGYDTTVTHPSWIRRTYNAAQRIGPLPPDLDEIISDTSIELDTRSAERVVKLVRRSEAGDEGSALVV